MFTVHLKKELLVHLHTFRFAAAVIAVLTLVIISLFVLGQDYDQRLSNYERLADQHALEALEVKVPSHLEPVLLRTPSPLAIFAVGAERRIGDMVRISRWEVPREAEDSYSSTLMLNSVQNFDLLTIFIFVASLFGVLLSYDALSGEKRDGTLKLMSACSASLGTIHTAKFVAATIAVAVPFLFALLAAPLFLMLIYSVQFAGPQWIALGLMFSAVIIYIAIFVSLGMLCSSLTTRPATSLVLALLCWTVSVFVIPVAIKNVVSTFHPSPDPNELLSFQQQTYEEARTRTQELYNTLVPAGRRYGQWNAGFEGTWLFDAAPQVFIGLEDMVREKENLWLERADRIWSLAQDHHHLDKRQAQLLDVTSIISPSYQFQATFTAAAGTDYDTLEEFLDACRRFRRAMLEEFRNRGYFSDNVIALFSRMPKEKAHSREDFERRASEYQRMEDDGTFGMDTIDFRNSPPIEVNLIPEFEFEANKPNIDRAIYGLLILTLWAAGLYLAGYLIFQRYDIR